MSTRFLLTLTATFFLATASMAQTEDDNIEFLRVQNQISEGNYRRALILLSNISEQGKRNTFYISYKATCYENLAIYDSAAFAYKHLYDKTKSFDAMKKVAEMKDKDDAKKGCTLCHGSGSYSETRICNVCNGTGTKSKTCNKNNVLSFFSENGKYCNGSGKCNFCNGLYWSTWERSKCYECDYGKCRPCDGKGKLESPCYECNMQGKITNIRDCSH